MLDMTREVMIVYNSYLGAKTRANILRKNKLTPKINYSGVLGNLYLWIIFWINWRTETSLIWKICRMLLYIRLHWLVFSWERELCWTKRVHLPQPGSLTNPPLRSYLPCNKVTVIFPSKLFLSKMKKTISRLFYVEKDFKIEINNKEI